MSPEERARIRAAANATTGPSPGVMPAWVADKPWCRWAWQEMPTWRRDVETMVMPPQVRANYAGIARRAYAAEMLRKRQLELPFEPLP